MKNSIVYITLCLAIAFMMSSCMGVSSNGIIADDIPSNEISLTDAGNPDEPEELMKTYINPEFEVKVQYPGAWELEEIGTERAEFTSSKGEELLANFMWLNKGDTLESFLTDVRGDISDLNEIVKTSFDRTLCAPAEESDDDMLLMECYHYFEFGKGLFVASVTGLISKSSLGIKAEPFGTKVQVSSKALAEVVDRLSNGEPEASDDDDDVITEAKVNLDALQVDDDVATEAKVNLDTLQVTVKPVLTTPTVLPKPYPIIPAYRFSEE